MSADGTISYLRRTKQRSGRMSQCRSVERNEERQRNALITLSGMLRSGEFTCGSDEYLQLQQYVRVVAARFSRPNWTPAQIANLLHMPRARFMLVLGDAVDYAEKQAAESSHA